MIPMVWERATSSAERKEMAISEVREELWMTAVTIKPLKIDLRTVSVVFLGIFSSTQLVNNLKPSSINNMPTMKSAIPETIVLKSSLASKAKPRKNKTLELLAK